MSPRLRELYRRQGGRCHYCRRKATRRRHADDSATVDHVKPLSQGGSDTMDNLVMACHRCNHAKADSPPPKKRDGFQDALWGVGTTLLGRGRCSIPCQNMSAEVKVRMIRHFENAGCRVEEAGPSLLVTVMHGLPPAPFPSRSEHPQ